MGFIKASGIFKGIVVNINDPTGKFHRIQVRIPKLHGPINKINGVSYTSSGGDTRVTTANYTKTENLPWCEVVYPFNTDFVPEVGQVVAVAFFNGDTTQPVVLGWLGYEYTDTEPALESINAYGNS